MSLPAREPYL